MANKDEYQRRLKAALKELAAARAALLPVPADGDKAPFTFSDEMADKLLSTIITVMDYHNVVDHINLNTEVHV
ncbi:hypothetical protein [Arsukibacterium indicum]|uniref:Uncharacterized protein n=1 Tax=Arsukibacterium indicum TaxID=2848612 RepID=A0ABS6MGK4_9GAMM|nr:hypothetical protein [Arsukibacterium indicum]MBV2127942.1 hypothetical protein [Arsukibacterium indicum]